MIYTNSITVCPSEIHLKAGEWSVASATVCPENASAPRIAWSSSDPAVVSVNELTGELYGRGIGSATIYAMATDGSGTVGSSSVVVSQSDVNVSLIMLSPNALYLVEYECTNICASVYPANATNPTLVWTSSNEDVVVVDDEGNVCALGSGTATITAAATDGSGVTACCSVAVCQRYTYLHSVTLNTTEVVLEKGQTYTLSATVCPSYTHVSWRSGNDAVVSVCDGVITANGSGTTTVIATVMDEAMCTASCTVTVTTAE